LSLLAEFTQKPFVEGYIRKCIEARKEAKSKFDKGLFKTAQVANFGM